MRLLLAGCEYSGTTTLAHAIAKWAKRVLGTEWSAHDHGKMPHISGHGAEWAPDRGFLRPKRDDDWLHPKHPDRPITALSDEEEQSFLSLTPRVKEFISRLSLHYHTPAVRDSGGGGVIGHHIDDAVYGPLYFGYGGDDEPNGKPRSVYSRIIESQIMEYAPSTVLVLMKASPEVILARMKESPHRIGVVQEKDIEHVLRRFEEEYERSIIRDKFTLDTSTAAVEETLAEFVSNFEPYLSEENRVRILTRSI